MEFNFILIGFLLEWWDPAWGWWIFIASALMFVGSLAALPFILAGLPSDYLLSEERRNEHPDRHPVLHLLLTIGKNVLGVVLVLLGVIMLITPGQGILTIVVGLMFLDIPGKHELIQRFMRRPHVLSSINRIREKMGKPPLAK